MTKQRDNETSYGSESGFSMIELLIAMAVILIGLMSIVGISAYVSRANYTSNTLNVLAAAAQDQVDRLRTAVWNTSSEDPSLAVGGSVALAALTPDSPDSTMSASLTSPLLEQGWLVAMTTTTPSSPTSTMSSYPTSQTPTRIYTYTIDPDNPHRAAVTNTPAGNLSINWQVRQGSTPELRYVTIRVAQSSPSRGLERGFTVSTIIVRN